MIEKIFNKIWYTKKGENYFLFSRLISLSLLPITFVYYVIISLRKYAYNFNLLKTYHFKIPIIIVGNYTVGGSGKTPFCIWLANRLTDKGLKVGIVSSGYKASSKHPQLVNNKSNPYNVGDEAVMIAQLTKANVVSCGNRVEATKVLMNKFDNDIIIHDDGLQHYALARDYEIELIDPNRLYGNNFLLPSGPLRELKNRANKPNIIISHRDSDEFDSVYADYFMHSICKQVQNIVTKEIKKISSFHEKKIHLVIGIANINRILRDLREEAIGVGEFILHEYGDHYLYQGNECQFNDDIPVFLTMKDYVKLKSSNNKNVWVMNHIVMPEPDLVERLDKDLNHIINYEN